jgi:hypothetical protein
MHERQSSPFAGLIVGLAWATTLPLADNTNDITALNSYAEWHMSIQPSG